VLAQKACQSNWVSANRTQCDVLSTLLGTGGVFEGADEEAFVLAVSENISHGLVLTLPNRGGLRPPGSWNPILSVACDHAAVEDVLLRGAFGADPADPAVRALSMDHTNAGGDAVLLVAPVRSHDLVAVQRHGRRLPRKSSCFVPKPAPGLVQAHFEVP
jgi:hypothetical protein